jgi:hypothetical protein
MDYDWRIVKSSRPRSLDFSPHSLVLVRTRSPTLGWAAYHTPEPYYQLNHRVEGGPLSPLPERGRRQDDFCQGLKDA